MSRVKVNPVQPLAQGVTVGGHGNARRVVPMEVRFHVTHHMSAFHVRIHTEADAGILGAEAKLAQVGRIGAGAGVGCIPEVRPHVTVGVMVAIYAGEIHKGNRGNGRRANVDLKG